MGSFRKKAISAGYEGRGGVEGITGLGKVGKGKVKKRGKPAKT